MPHTIKINPDDLTLGEVETIEELTGAPLSKLIGNGGVTAKAAVALVYVIRRRSDPDITLEAVKATRLGDIDLEFVASTPDPTDGGD